MNRAPQSVWHFLLNAKVKQFFNIQKKRKSFLQNNIKNHVFTKHFDISTWQTAACSRQSHALGLGKYPGIYIWFGFFFIILQPNDGKEARMESHADTPSAMNTITSTKQQLR